MSNEIIPIGKVNGVRLAAAAGGIAVIGLASWLLWMALLGTVSLIGIGACGVLAIGAARSLPLLAQKWENKLLSLRKTEARKNPHEQMDNEYIRRQTILNEEEVALTEASSTISTLKTQLDNQLRQNPEFDLAQEYSDLKNMAADLEERVALLKEAKEELVKFKNYIALKKQKHKYALEANRVRDKLNSNATEQATNAVLFDEADDEMERQYNRSFAAMEIARATRSNKAGAKALANNPSASFNSVTPAPVIEVLERGNVVNINKG